MRLPNPTRLKLGILACTAPVTAVAIFPRTSSGTASCNAVKIVSPSPTAVNTFSFFSSDNVSGMMMSNTLIILLAAARIWIGSAPVSDPSSGEVLSSTEGVFSTFGVVSCSFERILSTSRGVVSEPWEAVSASLVVLTVPETKFSLSVVPASSLFFIGLISPAFFALTICDALFS